MKLNYKEKQERVNNNKLNMFKNSLTDSDTMLRELVWSNQELKPSKRWILLMK